MLHDIKYALRMLVKNPGFTAIALVVLSLGIGANAAMFSLVNALLFRPIVAERPQDLVGCYNRHEKGHYRSFSYPDYIAFREKNEVFSHLMGHTLSMVGIAEGDTTRRVFAGIVSANYFATMGVRPVLGRDFAPEEEKPGSAQPVAIVSHHYWKKIGQDPGIIRQSMRINGRIYNIIGVAPEYFTGTSALISPEVWLPLGNYELLVNDFMNQDRSRLEDRKKGSLFMVGRLKPGISREQAESQMQTIASQLAAAYPEENKDYSVVVRPLPRLSISTSPGSNSEAATLSVLLMATSSLILLIACLNLANMLLARSSARRKEIGIRLALGGGRFRIIRQLLTESLVLSLLGGAVGLLLAYWVTDLLIASLNPRLGFLQIVFATGPDLRIVGVTMAFSLLSAILFGFGPAWKLSRSDVLSDLKEQTGEEWRVRGNWHFLTPRNLLVIGQVALSMVMVVTAGLFVRGAHNASQATPGFNLDHGLLFEIDPSLAGYDEARSRQAIRAVLERTRNMPGISSASVASLVPFGLFSDGRDVQRAGADPIQSDNKEDKESKAYGVYCIIGSDYFKTLGLPLLRGREFTRMEEETDQGPRVAIIDEPMARKLWPGQDVLGRFIQFAGGKPEDKPEVMEIVAIVPGVRHEFSDKEPVAHVYVPSGQKFQASTILHLRASQAEKNEEALLSAIRREISQVDPKLPVLSFTTLRGHRDDGLLMWFVRTGARLFTWFGALAVLLAVLGVYGVKAYLVSRRTREIGIRIALGASAHSVIWMVLRDGLTITLIGLTAGLGLAFAAGRLVSSMLYNVSAMDPLVFSITPLFMASAALLACYLPARRASQVQPMNALRHE